MQFKPNFELYREWRDAEHAKQFAGATPFIAVFKQGTKTLVYMGDRHCYNVSFDMVDMCFENGLGVQPDVLLTEMENEGYERKLGAHGLQDNTLAYAAAVAAKLGVPAVFADLSDVQKVAVINAGFPDNQITTEDLRKVFGTGKGPDSKGDIYQQMSAYLDRHGRDLFMLQNIAAALNKYDTVFVIFGAGHYEAQRLVLEDMMGKPEYITKIQNMRGNFSGLKIKPEKLIDFDGTVQTGRNVASVLKGRKGRE